MADVYRLIENDHLGRLQAGDLLLCVPYHLDPSSKLTVLWRLPDGLDPSQNVYRHQVRKLADDELRLANYQMSAGPRQASGERGGLPGAGYEQTTPEPAVYGADVDEMTAGQLAVLAQLRRRIAAGPAVEVIDRYAGELVSEVLDDE